jgi:outer membrane protein assembly factor BamE (lipoprotein component of BamABCDE complex)|tara:strand:- start:192 stop:641 length:450 start_codon:yes stop_codon:yes gene_type:complete
MIKKTITQVILCIFFLFSCSLTQNIELSGTANLEKKQDSLKIGVTNKNDAIEYLGEAILKEYPNGNNWAYIESSKVKNIFGKTKIVKNNILLLFFDNKGILVEKRILNIDDIKKLEFDQNITNSNAINDSFSKKFFGSMRKRFQKKISQ